MGAATGKAIKAPEDEWIGVEDVAKELHITTRRAWEWIKKMGIPCLGPSRNAMGMARFTRAAYREAVERSLAPPTPRGRKKRAKTSASPKPAPPSGGLGTWKDYVR